MIKIFAILAALLAPAAAFANTTFPAYELTALNTIDASQSAGSDMCAKIANAAASLYAASPSGGTIDARGFAGSQSCAGSMFATWFGITPTIPGGTNFPVTILQGNATITGTYPQIAPPWVRVVNTVPNGGPPWTQTWNIPSGVIVSGATYGSSSGTGTSCTLASPCSITQAQTNARAGAGNAKTIYLRAGTYSVSSAGTCDFNGDGIHVGSSDAGETWSYYPPDGIGTAIIDGGSASSSTGLGLGICFDASASNIIINGLQIQHFRDQGIDFRGFGGNFASNNIIENNIVHDLYTTNPALVIVTELQGRNNIITHNWVYNFPDHGIGGGTFGSAGADFSGAIFDSNLIGPGCTVSADCGGVYIQDYNSPNATGVFVLNNYVQDLQSYSVGRGIYLDDGASNITSAGNIVTGLHVVCFNIHGGANDIWIGNICDEGTNSGTGGITAIQHTGLETTGMTGNVYHNNITVAASASGATGGWCAFGNDTSVAAAATISNNIYFNYVGTSITQGACTNSGNDSDQTYINPLFSDPFFAMPNNSPAFVQPVSFPPISGNWGPPGYGPTMTRTRPSYGPPIFNHIAAAGIAPALTSCGTSPTITGNDMAGIVTMGTTATGCVISFAKPYNNVPFCVVDWIATPLASQSYVTSATAITLTSDISLREQSAIFVRRKWIVAGMERIGT